MCGFPWGKTRASIFGCLTFNSNPSQKKRTKQIGAGKKWASAFGCLTFFRNRNGPLPPPKKKRRDPLGNWVALSTAFRVQLLEPKEPDESGRSMWGKFQSR